MCRRLEITIVGKGNNQQRKQSLLCLSLGHPHQGFEDSDAIRGLVESQRLAT